MRTRRFIVATLLTGFAAACGPTSSAGSSIVNIGAAVSGYVHAGPTCPVVQDPPTTGCQDRPVAGARLVVLDGSGREVASITSAPDGTFRLSLAAGSYTLVPQAVEGLLGTAPPLDFAIAGQAVTDLDVAYDTGIR